MIPRKTVSFADIPICFKEMIDDDWEFDILPDLELFTDNGRCLPKSLQDQITQIYESAWDSLKENNYIYLHRFTEPYTCLFKAAREAFEVYWVDHYFNDFLPKGI